MFCHSSWYLSLFGCSMHRFKDFKAIKLYSLYYTKSFVWTSAQLTLETYVNYLENPLCLHSNDINSSSECLKDEMNVFKNCNCLHGYHPKYEVPNEWWLWFFQFIFPLSRLVKVVEVVSKMKLLMLTDDQCTLQDTVL